MIVDNGKRLLLDAQRPFLADCLFGLFTNTVTFAPGTLLAAITPAAWLGYAQVVAGLWATAFVTGHQAQTRPLTPPSWINLSGSPKSFNGWYLVDPTGTTLIAGEQAGTQTIADHALFVLNPVLTDNQL